MSRTLRQAWLVARRDWVIERAAARTLVLGAASGLLGLLAYHFVGRLVADGAPLEGGGYLPFVCAGLALQLVVVASLGALGGGLAREAGLGSLEAVLASGASPAALLLGRLGVPVALASAQGALYLAFASARLGVEFHASGWPLALAGAAAALLGCAPVGLLGAAAWLVARRAGLVTTVAGFGLGLLGGVYFPVALLPDPWRTVAAWVPFTAGLEVVRGALLEGRSALELAPALARALVVGAALLAPALLVLRASLTRARRAGGLALA